MKSSTSEPGLGMPLFIFFSLFAERKIFNLWHKKGWVGGFISPLVCVSFLQLFTNVVVPWFCFALFFSSF